MPEPNLVVVGNCTTNSVRVIAVFSPQISLDTPVHLFFKTGAYSGYTVTTSKKADPFSMVLFEITELPSEMEGTFVEYYIAAGDTVDPDRLRKRTLKLLPAGRPLRIGLLSCNGIFRVTDENRRYVLWRALKEEVLARKVDLLIHAGDQIYADSVYMQQIGKAANDSLNHAEILAAEYRKIYFDTWTAPEIQPVLESCPSFMMWDDHDIYDGYGSHGDDSSPLAQTLFAAAKTAFRDFQTPQNPAPLGENSFSFITCVGDVAFLVIDARSNRMWKECRILGDAEIHDLEASLEELLINPPRFLLIVTAIPFVHVPVLSYLKLFERIQWKGALLEDLRDSWTAQNNQEEARRILSAFFRFKTASPGTEVILLGGDVHVATFGSVESRLPEHSLPDGSAPRIHQIVSSGIGSPPPYGIVRMLLQLASEEKVELLDGAFSGELRRLSSPDQHYLLTKRNFAVLQLGSDPTVEFFADYKGRVIRFHEKL
jgi:hypothetical protein